MTRRPLAALLFASCALAQEASPAPSIPGIDIDQPRQLPALVAGDLKAAATAPASWKAEDWGRLSLGILGLAGLSIALDRPADQAAQRLDHDKWDPWARRLDTLGGTGTVVIAGGAYLGGVLIGQPRMREFGSDACLSMAVAQLLVTLPLKVAVGRSRPDADQGPYHFDPFSGGQAFPSGHATQAFTLATVVSAYADNPWATGAAYTGATLVGLARIEQRAHWASDVAAGALIGTLSAKAVLARHHALRLGSGREVAVEVDPVWQPGSTGMLVSLTF